MSKREGSPLFGISRVHRPDVRELLKTLATLGHVVATEGDAVVQ